MDNHFVLTGHSATRLAQRCISKDDAKTIRKFGTEVGDGFVFREKDFETYENDLKRELDRVKRLIGAYVVMEGNVLITAYYTRSKKQRKLLRRAKDHSLSNSGGSHVRNGYRIFKDKPEKISHEIVW